MYIHYRKNPIEQEEGKGFFSCIYVYVTIMYVGERIRGGGGGEGRKERAHIIFKWEFFLFGASLTPSS